MLFNSIDFAIFLPIVFVLYWFGCYKSIRVQNGLILLASYVFYGWWDWRFLSLLAFSTIVDYSIGRKLATEDRSWYRKLILCASITVNLGVLGFFKYFNFFLDNFKKAFTLLGQNVDGYALDILLPVGISFYTFQTMSYTIDVYRKHLEPTKNFVAFASFVSFFPQLVAGPIERATHLVPQFLHPRRFDYGKAVDGLRQILWGLFKKVVIADNCAEFANLIFNNYEDYNGSTLLLGAIFFSFQIYGDFSGYSDIAIGTARLFGFNLMQNFAYPYFSRDIAEFWRRWHISLSTWFRDYLYIPLGGSRGGKLLTIRNTFIIFVVSGFWHGANWTFIVWGVLNALYFMPLLLLKQNRSNLDVVAQGKILPSFREVVSIASTFLLIVLSWIFFRSESISDAMGYLSGIFSESLLEPPRFSGRIKAVLISSFVCIFLLIEWIGRKDQFAIEKVGLNWPWLGRWAFYITIATCVLLYSGSKQAFIYFQF